MQKWRSRKGTASSSAASSASPSPSSIATGVEYIGLSEPQVSTSPAKVKIRIQNTGCGKFTKDITLPVQGVVLQKDGISGRSGHSSFGKKLHTF
jgi:hypothetical protein